MAPLGGIAGAGAEFLVLMVLAAAMGFSMVRRPNQGFFRPVMLAFVPVAVMLAPMVWNADWMEQDFGKAILEAWNQSVAQMPPPPDGDAEAFKAAWEARGRAFLAFLPAGTAVFWLGLLSLTAWLLRRFLAARGKTRPAPPLTRWQSPEWVVWLFLLPAMVLLAAANGLLPQGRTVRVAGNLLLVVGAVYLFQGAQVLRFRLARSRAPWALWLALGAAFLFLGAAAALSLGLSMALIGILDLWFDFRRLQPPKEVNKEES